MVPRGIKATSQQHTAAGVAFLRFRSELPKEFPKDTPFLKKARARFKLANDTDADQAKREQDDIRFEAGDQWPADIKQARQGQQPTNGLPAVPARPTLVINKVREPVRQVLNQERQSDIGVEIVPADDFGDLGITPDDTEITLREGLVRRIQRESQAADARTWAFKRAVIAGRGYYLVSTKYLPGKTYDQEVCVERIYNQDSVKGDPSRTQPDGSDAEYWFWGTWMLAERFLAEYPFTADGTDNPFSEYGDAEFMGLTETYPGWFKSQDEDGAKTWSVRVENYVYVERESKQLCVIEDGTVFWKDELPEGAAPVDTRTVITKTIKMCKLAGGVLELERTDFAGPDMPVVQVLGEEVLPYDEQTRVEGMVRNSRDAQMGFNYMISKQVEQIGLTPIPPLQIDPEAIDTYEPWYAVANTRALPYLPYRTYNDEGKELRPPTRLNVEPNVLPIAQSIALFDQTIKSTTAVPDSTLGNVDPALKSGRAIREVVANAQMSTSNFLDNLARSIRYEGQIVNNLLFPIYGSKPGRLVRILTGEGEAQTMRIDDPAQAQQQAAQQQQAAKVAKLTEDAHFNVIVKVAKGTERRRDQFVQMFGDILGADPSQMAVGGDLFYKNMDIPEAKQLAKRQRTMLAPPIQQMLAAEEQGQNFDPIAQAKIAQLTEQLQHAEGAMKELDSVANGKVLEYRSKLETEQARQKAETERLQIEAERDIELQRMKDATAIRVAEAKLGGESDKLLHEADALNRTQAHEAALQITSQEHDQRMAATQMAHAAAVGDGDADREDARTDASREHEVGMAQMGQAHALEQSEQAAELAPEPSGEGA